LAGAVLGCALLCAGAVSAGAAEFSAGGVDTGLSAIGGGAACGAWLLSCGAEVSGSATGGAAAAERALTTRWTFNATVLMPAAAINATPAPTIILWVLCTSVFIRIPPLLSQ
jgi:hypothetical protein